MGEPSGVWESRGEMWVGAALNGDTTWEHLADWGGGTNVHGYTHTHIYSLVSLPHQLTTSEGHIQLLLYDPVVPAPHTEPVSCSLLSLPVPVQGGRQAGEVSQRPFIEHLLCPVPSR